MALSGLDLAGPPIIGCDKPGGSPITNFNFTGPADNTTKTLTSVYWEIPGFDITCAQANATITDDIRYLIDCTLKTSDPIKSYRTFSDYPGLEDTRSTSFLIYTYCDPNWYIYSYQGIFKFSCDVKDSVKMCVPENGTFSGVVMYDSRKMLGPPEDVQGNMVLGDDVERRAHAAMYKLKSRSLLRILAIIFPCAGTTCRYDLFLRASPYSLQFIVQAMYNI